MVLSWAKLIGQNLYHTIRPNMRMEDGGGGVFKEQNGMCNCTNTIHILNVTWKHDCLQNKTKLSYKKTH